MSDYIPQDLHHLFLKRLPVKTIFRFRIVCKWWKQVIDSQSFPASHLALQKPRLLAQDKHFIYLVTDPTTRFPMTEILRSPIGRHDGNPNPRLISYGSPNPRFVSCVHGVVCLHFNRALHLWNPSIHRLSAAIPLTTDFPYSPIPGYYRNWFGFWIDPSNSHSKIVIICPTITPIYLFSSTTRAWMEVASDTEESIRGGSGEERQVMINGVAHWNAQRGLNRVIAYFDFVHDKFGTIEMPIQGYNTNVGKWQDSLSLVHGKGACECDLWVMQNGLWSKMFSFNLADDVFCADAIHNWPIFVRVYNKNHVVLYDEIRGEFLHWISIYLGYLGLYGYDFVESLVFPDL